MTYGGGPMGPMGGPPGPMGYPGPDNRKYAGVDVDGRECQVCGVKFTDKSQLDQHIQLPSHLEKAKDIPVEPNGIPPEPEPYVPVPLTADSISSVRTKSHSIHCPFCKVWFPSITILKYYHSVRDEHQDAVTRYIAEKPDGDQFCCAACKISAKTPMELWEECQKTQKLKMFGSSRSHSCDMCDVHLSEADWLEKHLTGEKHKWIANRVENVQPVQFEPQEMVIVQKTDFNQYTWQYHFYPHNLRSPFQCERRRGVQARRLRAPHFPSFSQIRGVGKRGVVVRRVRVSIPQLALQELQD